jgi:hypothetical protein
VQLAQFAKKYLHSDRNINREIEGKEERQRETEEERERNIL